LAITLSKARQIMAYLPFPQHFGLSAVANAAANLLIHLRQHLASAPDATKPAPKTILDAQLRREAARRAVDHLLR